MSEALSIAGTLIRTHKNYSKALKYISEEIKLNPNNYKAYILRGICEKNMSSDLLPKAMTSFAKAIELDPDNAEALVHMAHISILNSSYDKARMILENVINSKNDFHANAFELLADLYKRKKKYNIASEYYSKAINLSRNSAHLYYQKSICEYTIGIRLKYSREAIENFKASVTYAEVARDLNKALPRVDELIKEAVFGFFASKYGMKSKFYRIVLGFLWFARDTIIEIIRDHKKIDELMKKTEEAAIDPKMKIRTASTWEETFPDLCFEAQKSGGNISVLFIDMDDMHNLNAIYSYDGVDNMLRSIGKVMNEICGINDLPVKFGGDEYIIIMKESDKDDAIKMYEAFLHKIERIHESDEPNLGLNNQEARKFNFSCGIVSAPMDMENSNIPWHVQFSQKLSNCIDTAKLNGKNQLVVYDLNKKQVFEEYSSIKAKKGEEALKDGKRA